MMAERAISIISLDEIEKARANIRSAARRTPVLSLEQETVSANIHLKLENLQAIGSFKIRGASNAMAQMSTAALRAGVTTASMGNMAQGIAWNARQLGIPCRVIVPENAPAAKLAAIQALGAETKRIPFPDWWEILLSGDCPQARGHFIHPVCDAQVIAGHGSIALELLEDLPDLAAVVLPFGGGGLALGIASAMQALRPATRVIAVEPETANPLARSWASGVMTNAPYQPSYIDGCGGASILPQMWPALRQTLSGAVSVTLAETAAAIRLLAIKGNVVAEGAGAVSLAATLAGKVGDGPVACIISGGNIDANLLAGILRGEFPQPREPSAPR